MEEYAKMTKLVWSGSWKLLLVPCSLLGENDHAKQASDQKLEAGARRQTLLSRVTPARSTPSTTLRLLVIYL